VDPRWPAQVRCGLVNAIVNNEKPVSRAGFANKTPDTRREYIFGEPSDYESVARLWVANKKYLVTNVISSAVLWSLWKLRNDICFQGVVWLGMRMVLIRITKMLRGWLSMYKQEVAVVLEELIVKMEELSRRPHTD
jgi:hypothetical protein